MNNERTYLRCKHCGNIIELIKDMGPPVSCCGEEMTHFIPNTMDAAAEKHVPTAIWEELNLIVTVGSTLHPMTKEHHIAWIAIAQGNRTQRATLKINGEPSAIFHAKKEPLTIYAYCNLHGLWKAEIE